MDDKQESKGGAAGLFIPAGIFIGLGAGFIAGNVPAGLFLGMGIGFVCFALASSWGNSRDRR
jgi:hypothetical protein